ncbi:unnamed protein product [marine sediment metagenome]|uniref:Uncharacterized protein n=1 Tax=marine sediment metagenome TaxID=412755 RepID=X0X666_9ZZZZ
MEIIECGACNGYIVTSNREFRVFNDAIARETAKMIKHDLGEHGQAWADQNFYHEEGRRWDGNANIFIWHADPPK